MSRPADATSESGGGARDYAIAGTRTRSPRVYLECTTTYASGYNTGIQRTVRSIVEAALALRGPWLCVPVIFNGRYFEAIDRLPVTRRMPAAPSGVEALRRAFHIVRAGAIRFLPFARLHARLNSPRLEFALRRAVYAAQNARRWVSSFHRRDGSCRIAFVPGDVVVLLDATWGTDLSRELRRARAGGARVWAVVQDLIPINHPDIAPEGLPLLLDAWLRRTIPLSDGLLAISRSVADDLRAYTRERFTAETRSPFIDSFYLGAGFDPAPAGVADLARIRGAFDRGSGSVYLVVGTIEPRKDCAGILAAFERLWADGSDATLMLFGRAGWRSYDLIDRLRSHPEHGGRLFWFEDGSDAELDFAYRHAAALIFASRCEGFGLPLVEAMRYGLPVLASHIPIFREIGGDYPEFFRSGDELAIYDAIRRFDDRRTLEPNAVRTPKHWLSWSDSAQMMLDKVTAPQRSSVPRPIGATLAGPINTGNEP